MLSCYGVRKIEMLFSVGECQIEKLSEVVVFGKEGDRNASLHLCAPDRDAIPVGGRQTEELFQAVRLEGKDDRECWDI